MIQPICKDIFFLGQKSEQATEQDKQIGQDLLDTLRANREQCVGMAANMIGIRKNIIVVNAGLLDMIMYNPVIVSKKKPFETEEGCLSLDGVRKTIRYKEIEVDYCDVNFHKKRGRFTGWTAQIIQHEVDQCEGIVI